MLGRVTRLKHRHHPPRTLPSPLLPSPGHAAMGLLGKARYECRLAGHGRRPALRTLRTGASFSATDRPLRLRELRLAVGAPRGAAGTAETLSPDRDRTHRGSGRYRRPACRALHLGPTGAVPQCAPLRATQPRGRNNRLRHSIGCHDAASRAGPAGCGRGAPGARGAFIARALVPNPDAGRAAGPRATTGPAKPGAGRAARLDP